MNDETRKAIGTVWHTTEKVKDIVCMHDAQWRALTERIAALTERAEKAEAKVAEQDKHIETLREECRAWRTLDDSEYGNGNGDVLSLSRKVDAARAATDAANALEEQ